MFHDKGFLKQIESTPGCKWEEVQRRDIYMFLYAIISVHMFKALYGIDERRERIYILV